MTSSSITAIVLTLNEEEHLRDCLLSLRPIAREVVVLDSGSTDRTVEIARELGARVEFREFDGYASQRNAALELFGTSEWTLFVDADERFTSDGAREVVGRVASAAPEVAAFWIPRRNVLFGKQIRGGGWWPDYQARLFRRGRARYDERREVHEVAVIDGASERLSEPIIHLNYATRREFLKKQRAFTERRVRQHGERRPRRRAYLSSPAREFYRRLIRERGYRDGIDGVFLAATLAAEEARACWLLRRRLS